jgi:histidine triad (HIT) family protein
MVARTTPAAVYSRNMDSIFTKIIKREIPANIIYEDEYSLVIPDIFPSMPGQLVVITKRQVPYVYDLTDEEYHGLLSATKKAALALDQVLHTVRTCSIIEGFDVPHVHVRLYPCTTSELILEPRTKADDADLKELTEKLKAVLE